MDKLKKLELWIEKGALFEKINNTWTAFLEDDFFKDLGSGDTFENMIDSMPSPVEDQSFDIKCEFDEIEIGKEFMYLDEKWTKTTKNKAVRSHDGFLFSFYDNTIVN